MLTCSWYTCVSQKEVSTHSKSGLKVHMGAVCETKNKSQRARKGNLGICIITCLHCGDVCKSCIKQKRVCVCVCGLLCSRRAASCLCGFSPELLICPQDSPTLLLWIKETLTYSMESTYRSRLWRPKASQKLRPEKKENRRRWGEKCFEQWRPALNPHVQRLRSLDWAFFVCLFFRPQPQSATLPGEVSASTVNTCHGC